MKFISIFKNIFSKVNTVKEIFIVIQIIGETLEFAANKFEEADITDDKKTVKS